MSNPASPQIDPSPAEKFFGLAARPFSLTPDLRFAYHSRSHTHALEQVTSALRRREGLIVVTGAIGTGKTMLCRSMLESFESRTFLSVILDPGLEVEDLLRKVLTDFGIMSGIDAPAAGPISEVTRHQFVSTLQRFLASLIPLQAHAVIMIDEAQGLSPRVLEEIRLLSNFETDEAKLLQIVLVGQPELDELLRRPSMQQINQRVARRCELQPLSETEVGDYIERRLAVAASPVALAGAGGEVSAVSHEVARFSPAAVKAVSRISGGIPRLVNTLCDRALEAAYEKKMRIVEPAAITEAAERLRLDTPAVMTLPTVQRRPQLAAAVAAVVLLAGGAWWWMKSGVPANPPDTVQPSTSQTSAAAPVASPPTPSEPVAAASAPAPATAATAPVQSAGSATVPTPAAAPASFQIAVAAFKTEPRAQTVTEALLALQIPAAVRLDATGTWYRVIAGPFTSREAAQAAQDTLARNGYADTLISQLSSDAR